MKKILLMLFSVISFALSAASVAEDKYLAAAEKGDAQAQFLLGACYYNGYGVAKDLVQAVYWWRKAADQGFAPAQYNLGWCYYNGYGVAKDLKQAVYWLRKAADQGYKDAKKALKDLGY